jgi:hypothetical protein
LERRRFIAVVGGIIPLAKTLGTRELEPKSTLFPAFKDCISQMRPGVLYFNSVRIDYTSFREPDATVHWDAIYLTPGPARTELAVILDRYNLDQAYRRIEIETLLQQKPVKIGGKDAIIGNPYVDDPNVREVLTTVKRSCHPIYSTEFNWTWCHHPGTVPAPEKDTGNLVCNHFGYVEWSILPVRPSLEVECIRILQPLYP